MATFTATLTMPGIDYTKSATLDDNAVMAIVGSMIHRLGKVQDTNTDGTPKVDTDGKPVMRDMTPAEAVSGALASWIKGWSQNAVDDAKEAAAAAAKAAIPTLPDFTVL